MFTEPTNQSLALLIMTTFWIGYQEVKEYWKWTERPCISRGYQRFFVLRYLNKILRSDYWSDGRGKVADSEANDELWRDSGEVGGVRAVPEDRVFPGGVSALGQRWGVHGDLRVSAGGSRSQVCSLSAKQTDVSLQPSNTALSLLCNLMSLILTKVKQQPLYKTFKHLICFCCFEISFKWMK